MGIGLNLAFTSAASSMKTSQEQLAVISNNLANSTDTSYHRQSATTSNSVMIPTTNAYYGTGTYISKVSRSYDLALETSLRDSTSSDAYAQAYSRNVGNVEDVIGPDGDNALSDAMTEFSSSAQDLITNPEDNSVRESLLGTAETLADAFNSDYASLTSLRDYIATNDATGSGAISEDCDSLKTALEQIADLNTQIANYEGNIFINQDANTLRDERDALCSEVAKYASITVKEESSGKYTITLNGSSGSYTLIDGTSSSSDCDYLVVNMVQNAVTGEYTPSVALASDPSTGISLASDSGEIRALIDARSYISTQMTDLYSYASQFANAVNDVLNNGFDLNGSAGADMFSFPATQPASGNIISLVMTDGSTIAASGSATQDGNSDNAQVLWDTVNTDKTMDGSSMSYAAYATEFLTQIAQEVSDSEAAAETTANIKDMYTSAVQNVSGVSTDDEMANMLQVQRTYQAAAKIMTAVDEMLQTAISMVR